MIVGRTNKIAGKRQGVILLSRKDRQLAGIVWCCDPCQLAPRKELFMNSMDYKVIHVILASVASIQ